MPALDYARVASLYDEYCVFADDIPFLLSQVSPCREPVLELMAGTGRLSLPLVEAGADLTCVDNSPAMLALLRRKTRGVSHGCRLVCADVREIPLRASFGRILLPFQGLSELRTEEDHRRLLQAVARRLSPAGRFVCTLHNPVVRLRTLDGSWHELGIFSRPGGGTLHLAVRGKMRAGTRIVEGEQRLSLRDETGTPSGEDLVLRLCFSLPEPHSLVRRAAEVGLVLLHRWGDFAGAAWDDRSSPVFVAVFAREGQGQASRAAFTTE